MQRRNDLLVPAYVEMLESRAMLSAANVSFDSGSGTLTFTGTSTSDVITVSAGTNSTVVTVGTDVQTLPDATSSNISAISFDGNNGASSLTVSGTTGDLELDLTNVAAVSATTAAGKNLNIDATGSLSLGTIATTNLSVTDYAGVTNSGQLTIAGTTVIDTGSKDLLLVNPTSSFAGDLTLTGKNLTVFAAGTIALNSTTATGSLAVTSSGTITDTGAWSVTGTTKLYAGTNAIQLTQESSFTGAISLTGTNASIVNTTATVLGASTLTGNLQVSSTSGAVINTGKLAIGGTTTIDSSGYDTRLLNSTNSFGGNVILTGNNLTVNAAGRVLLGAITADGNLIVKTTGLIATVDVINVSGTTNFNAGNFPINMTQAGNLGGAITLAGTTAVIQNSGSTIIGPTNLTNSLTILSADDITDTGIMNVAGTVSAISTDGNITLGTVASTIGGSVSVTGTGDVTILARSGLTFGGLTVGNDLSVIAGGTVTNAGTLSIAGTTSINAGSRGDVSLTYFNGGTANTFNGAVNLTGRNVSIDNNTALTLNTITAAGSFTATAQGEVTNTGRLSISGATNINAQAANDLTLDWISNSFGGAVSLNGNNLTVVALGNLNLGTVAAAGTLDVTTTGAISDTGRITVAQTTTVTAVKTTGSGLHAVTTYSDVSLSRSTNTFGGDLTLTGKNLTVGATGDLVLNTTSATGSLALTATGDISDSGVWTVAGTSRLATSNTKSIALTQENVFTGAIGFSGLNASFINTRATNLGASTLAGTLAVSSTAGSVTNSGNLTVAGITTIDGTGNDITLSSKSNSFGGAVILTGNKLTINGIGAISLGAITGTTLTVKTTGIISDSDVVSITGATSLNAGSAAILLTQADTFGGAISVSGSNASFTNTGATILGPSTLTGSLTVVAGDDVTNTGRLDIDGTVSIDVSAGGNNVTLNQKSNSFAGRIVINANNATILATGSVILGACAIDNNLSVTATGSVSDTFADTITVGGTTTINAGRSDINLTSVTSTYFGSFFLAGRNVTVNNTVAIDFGTTTVTGSLTATSGDEVTNSGAMVIMGALTIDADGGQAAITLDNPGDRFVGILNLSGNPIIVT